MFTPGSWEGGILDPEARRVMDWRHMLERMLLGRGPIKEEVSFTSSLIRWFPSPSRSHKFSQDMYACDEVFRQLEDYDEMSIDYLLFTKIGKVMRHIGQKTEIPCKEQFKFQERAEVLISHWAGLLTSGKGDFMRGSDSRESSGMDANSPILYNMMKARRQCIGNGGGLEVIVKNLAGRVTSSATLSF